MKVFNAKHVKERRRALRETMAPSEVILWLYLKEKQLCGFKFRRQHSIGEYVVDFYCPKAKLVVEVDGDSHYEPDAEVRDIIRTKYIESFGIKLIRFTNLDVKFNIDAVIADILSELSSTPCLSPLGRGTRKVEFVKLASPPYQGGETGEVG
ncbi:MAG: endonuclease domain-containing protein [Candidatus Uhrbacteria bacterium]|nr:endonuclease domain-containing protein [Patescibacteria group bacterium]MBU1906785.1 endonuclease domain-containing protein [Patescibacteria group bacterium]